MKRALLAILLIASASSQAAQINFALTNFDQTLATNTIIVTPISERYFDGSYLVTGIPLRIPVTNGLASHNFTKGDYELRLDGIAWRTNMVFAVPDSGGPYDLQTRWVSGGNVFNYSPGVWAIIAGSGITLSTNAGNITISTVAAPALTNNETLVTTFSNDVHIAANKAIFSDFFASPDGSSGLSIDPVSNDITLSGHRVSLSSGQDITLDGNLTAGPGWHYNGDAQGLTNVLDAALSSNIPKKNSANVFTASNNVPGKFTGDGSALTNIPVSAIAGSSGFQAGALNLTNIGQFTTNPFAGTSPSIGSIISNRNSAIINVKDFGALGNNVDDSLALKQAFIAWTNRGGTLYFPQGTYVDTNTYAISVSGQALIDGTGTWAPFAVVGDGEGDSRWQAKITNATFLWSTNLPINFSNIRIEDWTVGVAGDRTKINHGVRIYGAPQGNMLVSQTAFRNFLGYGLDVFSTDLGTLNQARFDGCGVGIRIGGFGDAWSGSVSFTKSVFAGMIYGFTNSASLGVRLTQGGSFYIDGNLNQNGIIVGPGSGFGITGGAFESSSNAVISVGFPPSTPAFVENAPQDASGSIGGIAINNFNMLDNGTANGNNLIKIYTAPLFIQLGNVNAGQSQGTAILSTLAGGDTIPVMGRGVRSATNFTFSNGSFIKGWAYGGPLDWNAGSGYASYNGTNQVFGSDPVSGVTNMTVVAPAVVGSRDFTNYVAWIANTFLLDNDASNYCSRAGINDFATKFAINQFVLDLKAPLSDGFIQITNLNAFWPMLGGTSNSTAQNLFGATNPITWQPSGGTYASDGVQGNGSSFYGDTALNLKTGASAAYNTNSAFIYVYSRTQSPTDQGRLASGEQFNSFTVRNGIYPQGSSIASDGPNNNNVATVSLGGFGSDFRGSFAATRLSSTASAIYAGTNQVNYVDASLATPNATFGFLARDTDQGADHFSNAKIQGGGVGGTETYAHYIDFKTKWERCLASIALGQSIGATGPGAFLNASNYFSGDANVAGRFFSVSHTNSANEQTASLNVTGNEVVGGTLYVAGATTLSNKLAVSVLNTITASNVGPSKLVGTDIGGQFTNLIVGSGLSLASGQLTATASGGPWATSPATATENAGVFDVTNLNAIILGGVAKIGSTNGTITFTNNITQQGANGIALYSVGLASSSATGSGNFAFGGAIAGAASNGRNFAIGDGTTSIGNGSTFSSILAGGNNTIPQGNFDTILNGVHNQIDAFSDYSCVGGYYAEAAHGAVFVWSDSSAATLFPSVGPNSFNVRATGGIKLAGMLVVPVLTKTTNYTFAGESGLLYDLSGGSRSAFLPASPFDGEQHWVEKISNDANTLTLDGNGHNVNGTGTKTTTFQYVGFRVVYQSSSSQWFVIP
jgi:hypothetical protein